MDTATAKAMLQLLLGKQWLLYSNFAQFLDQSKYKVINKDQWCNILEFSRSIQNDLHNYDIDGACMYKMFLQGIFIHLFLLKGPVMLDEFVEWLRQQRLTATSPEAVIPTTTSS